MSVSTIRQMKLGHELAKDLKAARKPRNKKELLVAAGYSPVTAEATPHVIFRQEGTINAINVALESQGFSEENAKKVVQEIMNTPHAEHKDRLKAAELVFKVTGSFAAEKQINLNVDTDELKAIILRDMARFRGESGKR